MQRVSACSPTGLLCWLVRVLAVLQPNACAHHTCLARQTATLPICDLRWPAGSLVCRWDDVCERAFARGGLSGRPLDPSRTRTSNEHAFVIHERAIVPARPLQVLHGPKQPRHASYIILERTLAQFQLIWRGSGAFVAARSRRHITVCGSPFEAAYHGLRPCSATSHEQAPRTRTRTRISLGAD